MTASNQFLHGTLDTLVLKILAGGARHGYAIARDIEFATSDALAVEEGSLYPALYRMERKGWIDAEWGLSDTNRKVKYYRITTSGRAKLRADIREWQQFSTAVGKLLYGT